MQLNAKKFLACICNGFTSPPTAAEGYFERGYQICTEKKPQIISLNRKGVLP